MKQVLCIVAIGFIGMMIVLPIIVNMEQSFLSMHSETLVTVNHAIWMDVIRSIQWEVVLSRVMMYASILATMFLFSLIIVLNVICKNGSDCYWCRKKL